MSADEVVEAVNWLLQQIPDSANISRETLLDWEKRGLVPRANYQIGSTDPVFPDVTPAEAFASWMLKHGPSKLTNEETAHARKKALKMSPMVLFFDLFSGTHRENKFSIEWLAEKNKILLGCQPDEHIHHGVRCCADETAPAVVYFEKAEDNPQEEEHISDEELDPPNEALIHEAIEHLRESMLLAIEEELKKH